MNLLEVSVESLDEGCLVITEGALPRRVVAVVPVHVVHQPAEAPALLGAQLAHAELLVVLRDLPLGQLAQRLPLDQRLRGKDLPGPAALPLDGGGARGGREDLHVLVLGAIF